MISLSTTDYLVIGVYLVFIGGLSILYRAKRFNQMFGEDKKPSWVLLAASLLMIEWSPMTDMMSMGLILENGYSGIWMLKSRFLLAGVPAILFATMWSRLHFKTDNELIRLRFSGKSAVILHIFRAIFLSIFVIPFFGAFIILALKKLLEVVDVNLMFSTEILLTCGVLLLVFKNSFHQKIRTDFFNAIICVTAPMIICYFIFKAYDGPAVIYETLRAGFSEQTALIPSFKTNTNGNSFPNFLVFILIQWWSVNIVDNSDPNAQRHLQAKTQFAAFKALFIPILVTSIMFLFISTIWDCGLLEYQTNALSGVDKEAFYLHIAMKYLPDGFKAIVLIAILFSFITTLESIINWAGALLTVDIVQTYLYKNGTDKDYKYLSFAAMLLVSVISLFFAFNNDKILNLQKFIFSISAGVAPVFMLRWFWWRINAWTQISAMLSSLVYTVIFDSLYAHHEAFKGYIDTLCSTTGLSQYPLKIVLLTFLVVCTWLIVMYCTQADDKEHLKNFVKQTGTGGLWPKEIPNTGYQLPKRIFLCLIFAITYILPFFIIWQYKFGSSLTGSLLLVAFLGSAIYVYHRMATLIVELK